MKVSMNAIVLLGLVMCMYANIAESFATQPMIGVSQRKIAETNNRAVLSQLEASALLDSEQPSIRSRMKKVVEKVRAKNTERKIKSMQNLFMVKTSCEFREEVADECDVTVAVMYHATWCKACQAAAPHFRKLARKYPKIKFVDVTVSEENQSLLQNLGVQKFPFGQIYRPNLGLVAEQPLLRKYVSAFEDKLLEKV